MTNYHISNLSENTPKAQQTKLETNLKAISGVDSVRVHPESGEVYLTFRAQQQPKREAVEQAVGKAGFALAGEG